MKSVKSILLVDKVCKYQVKEIMRYTVLFNQIKIHLFMDQKDRNKKTFNC